MYGGRVLSPNPLALGLMRLHFTMHPFLHFEKILIRLFESHRTKP